MSIGNGLGGSAIFWLLAFSTCGLTASAARAGADGSADQLVAPMPVPALRHSEETASGPRADLITITLAGDTGFSPNHAPVRPNGVARHGRFQTWRQTTSGIAPLVDGDINFLNVETVVTSSNRLKRDLKGQSGPFNFRTHPNGLAHLAETGFNVLSLANNHSMDYGVAGLRDTLRHVDALRVRGLVLAASGIGPDRETASRPEIVDVKGQRIGFSAIGIVTNDLTRHRAGPAKPGQIAYRFDDDFKLTLNRLADADADFRMLSIHYGIEGRVRTDARQHREWRDVAALDRGIDLIVGHHAHVPRGVEMVGDSVIFYGLGNFLHHGTANRARFGICKDFGVFARLHLANSPGDERPKVQAIEIHPITGTHRAPRPMSSREASARIHVLNYLARLLGGRDGRSEGVRFTPQRDGRGLDCATSAGETAAADICADWSPAPRIPSNLRRRITASCAK